jgi:hypothetical protein
MRFPLDVDASAVAGDACHLTPGTKTGRARIEGAAGLRCIKRVAASLN